MRNPFRRTPRPPQWEADLVAVVRAAASDLTARSNLASAAGLTFGGSRDLYSALGYKRTLLPLDYRARYERGDIAARVVDAYPKATWRQGAELVEDEDPEVLTDFEEAWERLQERLGVWGMFCRADILAGLGGFSIILIGAPGTLEEELPKGGEILYLAPYGPEEVSVGDYETDTENARFGMPRTYSVKRTGVDRAGFNRRVHWTRVIHVADGLLDDRVNGTPRLARVWNRLDDLDKVVGGGSEAFWLRVHQGTIFNIDKDITVSPEQVDKLKTEAEEFVHGMRRTLAARGFDVKQLGSDVSTFLPQVMAIISLVSGATGIPQRILLGSERGELASSQDKKAWDERVSDRRGEFAEPVVRQFVDRCIEYGILPEPTPLKEGGPSYTVRWPEIEELDDTGRAAIATQWAGLNAKAKGTVVTPSEIRDRVLRLDPLTPEQLAEIERQQGGQEDEGQEDSTTTEGGMGEGGGIQETVEEEKEEGE